MKIIILILTMIFQQNVFASSDAGTGGFAFLKLPAGSARIQGLGGNGVSLVEGIDAININPAGIAFAQMSEASFSYLSWLEEFNGKYVAYIKPYGTNVIGVNLAYYGVDGFDVRDAEGVPLDNRDVKYKSGFMSLTFAKTFFLEKFALGASLKGVMEDRYSSKDTNLVYDWGAKLKLSRRIFLGVSMQNVSGDKEKIVQTTRYGLTLIPSSFLALTVEGRKYSDADSKIGFGMEFSLPEEILQYGRFVLRAGYYDSGNYHYNYDDNTLDKLGLSQVNNWSFGIGIYSAQSFGRTYGLEYSLTPYGELGKTSQLSFKMQF